MANHSERVTPGFLANYRYKQVVVAIKKLLEKGGFNECSISLPANKLSCLKGPLTSKDFVRPDKMDQVIKLLKGSGIEVSQKDQKQRTFTVGFNVPLAFIKEHLPKLYDDALVLYRRDSGLTDLSGREKEQREEKAAESAKPQVSVPQPTRVKEVPPEKTPVSPKKRADAVREVTNILRKHELSLRGNTGAIPEDCVRGAIIYSENLARAQEVLSTAGYNISNSRPSGVGRVVILIKSGTQLIEEPTVDAPPVDSVDVKKDEKPLMSVPPASTVKAEEPASELTSTQKDVSLRVVDAINEMVDIQRSLLEHFQSQTCVPNPVNLAGVILQRLKDQGVRLVNKDDSVVVTSSPNGGTVLTVKDMDGEDVLDMITLAISSAIGK
ncbi:MAG: hypothetical protein QG551_220 [Patescibacteria group bacterium]|jgi:hypothetical protein|nr:hypothetical protein [Patescibacteria group bacterium]